MRSLSKHSTNRAVSVEYEAETDSYRAKFESTEIDPSMAVVQVMAHVTDTDPLQLDPLYESVDTELINRLCTRSTYGRREGDRSIEFTYLGFEVIVKSYGIIEVEPVSVDEE